MNVIRFTLRRAPMALAFGAFGCDSTLYRTDGSVAEVAVSTSGDIWSIGRIR